MKEIAMVDDYMYLEFEEALMNVRDALSITTEIG
jgi:hypothetical protein